MSVYKREGSKVFWASIPVKLGGHNRRLQISTGTQTKTTATTFQNRLVRLHSHVLTGEPVPPELNKFVSGLTKNQVKKLVDYGLVPATLVSMSMPFEQHMEDYLLDCRHENAVTVKNKRADITKAAKAIGATRLVDFTPDRLRPYFIELESSQSARSRNRKRTALKRFLDWTVEHGRLHEHKVHLLPRANEKKDQRRAKRALTDEELAALLNTAPAHRATVYFFIVRTGLRRKETKGVLWRDIDLEAGTLELFATRTKTCKPDIIPLPRQLVNRLRVLASQGCDLDQPVFPVLPRASTVERDLKRAGIAKRDANGLQVDLHALRTTYTTSLLRSGATSSEAMHATRHTNTRVLDQHYNRLNLDDTRMMVDRLPDIKFVAVTASKPDSKDQPTVAPAVARERLNSTFNSIDWLDEATKELLAFEACRIISDRYNTPSDSDRQHCAPIDITDASKSFKDRDIRAIGAVG